MQTPQPVTLCGQLVRLEPLSWDHLPALTAAALDPRIWGYTLQPMANAADIEDYVATALQQQAEGSALPFVQVPLETGVAAGSTRYMNIDVHNRRLEIGATWLNPHWQRSGINTEAKLLLLSHAFETLEVLRVEFKGDAQNAQSRNALVRIGASFEGILRQHMKKADGGQRDSFYFSILQGEWPSVKAHIQSLLARPR